MKNSVFKIGDKVKVTEGMLSKHFPGIGTVKLINQGSVDVIYPEAKGLRTLRCPSEYLILVEVPDTTKENKALWDKLDVGDNE